MSVKSLAFFNNKGGVGKTTLACNMASEIAKKLHVRVLVVDLDPQCNATQLLLTDEQWDGIYSNRRESQNKSVLRVLRHIRAGDSTIDEKLHIVESERFKVDVLAGHPTMSMVEDKLSTSWGEFRGGELGGARRSLWASNLVNSVDHDIVVFDVGPSLGAINRSALLASDRFVTPMAADLFSLYALDNISDWIRAWIRDYYRGYEALSSSSDESLEDFGITSHPRVISAFCGYTVQQYVTKNMGGTYRKVNAYDRYKEQIPERAEALAELVTPGVENLDLGIIPNMFSMIPLAQAAHSPISDLKIKDGLRGAQANQQKRYAEKLEAIAENLIDNLIIEEPK
jgi:cellulose biosynthesis protein BcsQ